VKKNLWAAEGIELNVALKTCCFPVAVCVNTFDQSTSKKYCTNLGISGVFLSAKVFLLENLRFESSYDAN